MLKVVVQPCKQNKGRTVWIRIVKLGTYTYHDKRRTSIAFQGQGSNVKVTCCQLECYFPLKCSRIFRNGCVALVYTTTRYFKIIMKVP